MTASLVLAAILVAVTSQYGVVSGGVFPAMQQYTFPNRTYMGMNGFPSRDELFELFDRLDGSVESPTTPGYVNASLSYNTRIQALPSLVLIAKSLEDVQEVVKFCKKWNLFLAIKSSGHSYIGRSTHDGSMMLNLGLMRNISFNLNSMRAPAGEITVQSGASWLEVYKEVNDQVTRDEVGNPVKRVVVGGSAHTVSMGGYTMGGGHSPMSPTLGLAVDSLLQATVVLADGRKAVASAQSTVITELDGSVTNDNDTSLFWAIRGGGGSTFGVVIDFTFKLHFAPQRFRRISSSWALTYMGQDIGSAPVRHILQTVSKMSRNWGGYIMVSGSQLVPGVVGSIAVFLNHFGSDDDASNAEADDLLNYNATGNQFAVSDVRYDSFIDYEVTALDPPSVNTYIFNSFVQQGIHGNSSQLESLVQFVMGLTKRTPTKDSAVGCTGVLIGGKAGEVPEGETPVNPSFRSGLLSLTCGIAWPYHQENPDQFYIDRALEMRDDLSKQGEGSYFNECAEDLDDWKTQFWGKGNNYARLLEAKRKWDPDFFFWCHNCVGSDLV